MQRSTLPETSPREPVSSPEPPTEGVKRVPDTSSPYLTSVPRCVVGWAELTASSEVTPDTSLFRRLPPLTPHLQTAPVAEPECPIIGTSVYHFRCVVRLT